MLPELTPLLVVDDADVEELMRSARADLAKLSLELRALQRETATAREALPADEDEPSLDLAGAQELLRAGVEERLARRRVERWTELEQAQREAARRIADAEAEASALVDAARAELLRALGGTSAPPSRASRAPEDSEWRPMTEVPPAPPAPPPPSPPLPSPQPLPSPPPPVATTAAAPLFASAPARPAGARNHVPSRVPSGNGWRNLLHMDVLLPLLAVLIVVVVLLAWVA